MLVSGDDATAKDAVAGLVGDLGRRTEDILDPGGVATATEHVAPLFVALLVTLRTSAFTVTIAR